VPRGVQLPHKQQADTELGDDLTTRVDWLSSEA
jgi:hypothetical protein